MQIDQTLQPWLHLVILLLKQQTPDEVLLKFPDWLSLSGQWFWCNTTYVWSVQQYFIDDTLIVVWF